MKFWDSSAIIPLLAEEVYSEELRRLYTEDSEITVWWGTLIETVSAVARLERESGTRLTPLIHNLQEFSKSWAVVQPSDRIRNTAVRLLRTHPLRAADATQLAAAIALSQDGLNHTEFVSRDARLSAAAEIEGFTIL